MASQKNSAPSLSPPSRTTMEVHERKLPKRKASVLNQTQMGDSGNSSRPTKQQQRQPPNNINGAVDDDAAETVEADDEYCNNEINKMVNLEFFELIPPGYRFCPLDEELIIHYLKKKVMGVALPQNKIVDVKLYNHNPEFLAERYGRYGENEWYFFTSTERKHLNGSRPNRATPDGYWKASGANQPIKVQAVIVGYKRALVFYKGNPKQAYKTNWLMQEYTLNDPPISSSGVNGMRLNDWVLCKIYKNYAKSTKIQPVGFSENQLTSETGVNETYSTMSDYRDVVVDSAGYIHHPCIQQPLQNGLLDVPQINDPSHANFVNLEDQFHVQDAAAISYRNNYETQPQMTHLDSAGYIHHPCIQQPLQNGLLDVPQINDPSHANFVNLEDQFHVQDAAAISYRNNYETQPQMVEPVGIIPPFIHQMENSMGPNYIPEEYNLIGFQENSMGITNRDNCYLQWQDSIFNWDYHDSDWNSEVDLANNEPKNPPN